jgi:hypothetical protein
MRFTAVLFFFVGVFACGLVGRFGTAREVSAVELALVVDASDVSELRASVLELDDAAEMEDDMVVDDHVEDHTITQFKCFDLKSKS